MSRKPKNRKVRKSPSVKEKPKNKLAFSGKTIEGIAIGLTFLIVVINYFICIDYKLDLNGDNISYYLLGKSILAGNGYSLYNDINQSPHSHFPPGYPVILSFLMIFSKNFVFLKIANGLFLLGSYGLVYKIAKKINIPWQVIITSIIFMAFNYHLLKSSSIMMSEIPFLFFSLLCLWCLMQVDFSGKFWKSAYFYGFLFALSFSFHIRTIGLSLVAGALFYLLLNKSWKGMAATVFGFFLLALPWVLRGKILGLTSNYQRQLFMVNPYSPDLGTVGLTDFFTRILTNVSRYVSKEIPSGLLPFLEINYREPSDWLGWVLGILLVGLILYGISSLSRYRSLVIGYLGGTFGIILLWPDVWHGTRFMLAILPIFALLVVFSSSLLIQKAFTSTRWNSAYASFLLLPVLLFFVSEFKPNTNTQIKSLPFTRLPLEAKFPYQPNFQNYFKLAAYAKRHLPKDAVIACRKPQMFHMYSDRNTTNYPYESDDQLFLEKLRDRKVTHVVLDNLGYSSNKKYLLPAVDNNPDNFKPVKRIMEPSTFLLKFIP